MKWLLRVFAFVAAFVLGSLLGSFFTPLEGDVTCSLFYDAHPHTMAQPAPLSGKVEVIYAGLESGDEGFLESGAYVPRLKFLISNGLDKPLSNLAHSPQNPFPRIEVDGREIQFIGRCGTGTQTFEIRPGQTVEVYVPSFEFTQRPRLDDRVRVSFYLDSPSKENKRYLSNSFLLPDKFRQAIRELDYAPTARRNQDR